jgi:hypothetical protein
MKCETCNKEYSTTCDYRQGRCPNHLPMITEYHKRFYNLIQSIKGLFV